MQRQMNLIFRESGTCFDERLFYRFFVMIQINGYVPVGILARDIVQTKFEYNKQYNYYYAIEQIDSDLLNDRGDYTDDE